VITHWLAMEGICQKVCKVKITRDLSKFTTPARGLKSIESSFQMPIGG